MSTAFKSADILLPKNADMSKWAVVACDQYTSEPEYWADVEKITEGAKSALNLILPEVYLEDDNVDERIADIHKNMDSYISEGVFEEFEIEYKYLKAVIEGGLERKPDNVLIYATSNRRHLIRETFRDKADRDEELHTNDTVQEKLSLVARFGVTIYFGSPDKKEFRQIVRTLAQKNKIEMPEEDLLLEANKWELSHGGLSGRTAQQFIDYLMGQN